MNVTLLNGDIIDINQDDVIWSAIQSTGTYRSLLKSADLLDTLEDPLKGVPAGYEVLKYIETNKKQYISTPCTVTPTSIFNLEMDIASNGGATGTSIGAQYSSNPAKTIFNAGPDMYYGTGLLEMYYCENSLDDPITAPFGHHIYTIDYLNKRAGYDGIYTAFTLAVTYYPKDYPFMIGAWQEDGTAYYETAGKFYSLEVEDNGEQIINLVPALRLSDNKPGMYDASRQVFLTNSGPGEVGYERMDGTYVAPV